MLVLVNLRISEEEKNLLLSEQEERLPEGYPSSSKLFSFPCYRVDPGDICFSVPLEARSLLIKYEQNKHGLLPKQEF